MKILLALLLLGAAPTESAVVNGDLLDSAIKAHDKGRHDRAVVRLWKFMKVNPPEIPEYERAEFYLASSLDALGYPHAAQELWINVGKGRRDARLLGPALTRLALGVQQRPYDADVAIDRLLGDTEFGYVPEAAADFVTWHQGLIDLQLGYRKWGKERLDSLEEGTPWYQTSKYRSAVRMLAADDIERARLRFEDLDKAEDLGSPVLKRRVQMTLARLAYEDGDWAGALKYYEAITIPIADRAPIILERAWCYYRLGQASRALGLLASLEAPVFAKFEDPERYLLAALIYKDLCHFDAAARAVTLFRKRFAKTLDSIHARADLSEDGVFVAMALRVPEVSDRQKLREDLGREEKRLIEDAPESWRKLGLTRFLETIYDANAERANRSFYRAFSDNTEEIGDIVLDAQEQMNVVAYEIELSRNRRAKDQQPPEPGELVRDVPLINVPKTFFAFDGEYWNEELENLRVVISPKCEETQPR